MVDNKTIGLGLYLFPEPRVRALFLKLFPLTFLCLVIAVFSSIRYGNQRVETSIIESLSTEEIQAAIFMENAVRQTLFNTTASLQYLVLLMERSLAASSGARGIRSIETTLQDFLNTHPAFDQLRFLDTSGREVVRVDAGINGAEVVPVSELQDKSTRDYFKRGLTLSRGSVAVNPLDFNKERGVIEYPPKPVIRFAMPVYDRDDSKAGVAIINYKASVLLDLLADSGKVARGNPNIVSLKGRWLMEPSDARPEGYVINPLDDQSFSERMPQEWRQIAEKNRGVFRTDKGLFSYRVFLPSAATGESSVNPVSWTVTKSEAGEEGGWVVLSHIPQARLLSIIAQSQFFPPATRSIVAVLVWISAWMLALQICNARVRIRDLKRSASTDDLTGLVARGEFDRNLQRALRIAERTKRSMGVVYIDLNNFKALNDKHGHASGDEVLIAVGERLAQACRGSDVAARLGGDEFAVILWELGGPADAKVAATSIADRLQKPLLLDHGEYQTGVSVGIAVYPEDGATAADLLAHADKEMYAAKGLSKSSEKPLQETAVPSA